MATLEDNLAVLREQLAHYPADRHPVEHATACFHLGCNLIELGRHAEAASILSTARALFGDLPLEAAKVANMLGVAARGSGDLAAAASAFESAAEEFVDGGHDDEAAAAEFNLGLVCTQQGETDAALIALERAGRGFETAGQVPAAIAAERERGAALLADGRFEEAAAAAGRAAERSLEIGDAAGHGAAANTLGLARLGLGRPDEAVASFRAAAASHPRSVRPQGYAMAKANLALAWADAGEPARARLAARQALHAPATDQPVLEQAERLLASTGTTAEADDVVAVLATEAPDRWEPVLREEAAHWADRGEAGSQIAGTVAASAVTSSPEPGPIAGAWLGVLLELPPGTMESLIAAALEAVAKRPAQDQRLFRMAVIGAMGGFHVPQWLRLRDTFAERARAVDLDGWA